MAIGGLDIGSTGAKITVVDRIGKQRHMGYMEYPVSINANTHEINANDIWSVVKTLLYRAVSEVPDMSAVGITSFGESFVTLNDKGEVLLPTMMYTDPRGETEASLLSAKLGDEFISEISGTSPHSMYSLPKLMWIKSNRPEVFSQIKYVCLIADFLAYKLTGNRKIDYSLAARTMGLNIKTKLWSEEIFEAAGIDSVLFSTPVPTGTDTGTVLKGISDELGLPEDMRIIICGHDQIAAAVGSNVTTVGMATDGGGTVQCMTPVFRTIPNDSTLQKNHYAVVPFLRENTYCCYAFSFTGGSLVKWFVDQFGHRYKNEAKDKSMTVYQLMESMMTAEPTGILTLPHFAGAATPYMDTGSRGAIVGLELSHSPIVLFKAIMEGITFEMRLNMEKLAEGGVQIKGLNATGGCARSKLWLQLKADILGLPITRMGVDEAGTIGGIILTGVATGVYADLDEATECLVRTLEVYYPRKDMHEKYEQLYQQYRKLYDAVRPLI